VPDTNRQTQVLEVCLRGATLELGQLYDGCPETVIGQRLVSALQRLFEDGRRKARDDFKHQTARLKLLRGQTRVQERQLWQSRDRTRPMDSGNFPSRARNEEKVKTFNQSKLPHRNRTGSNITSLGLELPAQTNIESIPGTLFVWLCTYSQLCQSRFAVVASEPPEVNKYPQPATGRTTWDTDKFVSRLPRAIHSGSSPGGWTRRQWSNTAELRSNCGAGVAER
jgi:hypothetical protein